MRHSYILLFCPILISMFCSFAALAVERTANEIAFSKLALDIPNRLLSAGADKASGLNLKNLHNEFEKTQVGVVPPLHEGAGVFIGSGMANRSTATFIMQDRYVLLMGDDWIATPREVRPAFALHENLSVSAVDDEHYQVSLAMWLLSRKLERGTLKGGPANVDEYFTRILPKVDIRKEPPSYKLGRGGTATGVGGGGDSAALEAKMIMLEALEGLGLEGERLIEAERVVLQTRIETRLWSDASRVEFDQELEAFTFGKTYWRSHPDQKNRIVHEILSKLKIL